MEQFKEAISNACEHMLDEQRVNGNWVFELEADCTIPADYIFMMHFTDEIEYRLQDRLANYLLLNQNKDGGWPLYKDGPSNLSCSVKAYYALKLAEKFHVGGYHSEHKYFSINQQLAHKFILSQGGAAQSNAFTRILLAQFDQIPWRGIPWIPVELMLLPKWSPFNIYKVSYWTRCVMIPLMLLYTYEIKAINPKQINCSELFINPPRYEKYFNTNFNSLTEEFIYKIERTCRLFYPFASKLLQKKAVNKALNWLYPRITCKGGLGAIFPAMMYSYLVLKCIIKPDEPHAGLNTMHKIKEEINALIVHREDNAYVQPCVSPIWDTSLTVYALQQANDILENDTIEKSIDNACQWIHKKQISGNETINGDWRQGLSYRANRNFGYWPFQFDNKFYPDVDDTSMCGIVLSRYMKYEDVCQSAINWIRHLQSDNGGWGAFDRNNEYNYMNDIPFADHGAMIDPPTPDVTGRCIKFIFEFYGKLDKKHNDYLENAITFLLKSQNKDGSWDGRWGTNKLWGTWSALMALNCHKFDVETPAYKRKAQYWIRQIQNADGGFGESNDGYEEPHLTITCKSNAFHTALGLMILCEVGYHDLLNAKQAADWLLKHQVNDTWEDDIHNAPGFPKVFYLKYHGYAKYFPIMALAQYTKMNQKD